MLSEILKTNRFLPLLCTQFFGAFNDNLFKNMLLTFIAFHLTSQSGVLSNVIAGLFIIPFFLFSATAGQLADKYNRARIARVLKVCELGLMLTAGIVFLTHSIWLLIILLCLMGVQSAFFGPIKYALIPQLLKTNELILGNAYIESSTYLAIILGLVFGTLLPAGFAIIVLIALAIAGYVSSRFIPSAPAPRPHIKINPNIFSQTAIAVRLVMRYPLIFRCILGATWFWTIGALMVVQVYPLTAQVFNGTKALTTFFLITFSVGVGVGSMSCNRLLKGLIHTTYVPLSAIGMSICAFILYALTKDYATPEQTLSALDFIGSGTGIAISLTLFVFAFCGGLYIVPIDALMQYRAPKAYLATIIGTNNIMNAFGMAAISVLAIILLALGLSVPELFWVVGIISIVIAGYICFTLPDALLKSLFQIVLGFFFSVRLHNTEAFKKINKKTILIANHTSLLDALLLAVYLPEKLTFAINSAWSNKWYIKALAPVVRLYPLDATNPMAVRGLIDEVKKGRRVVIFPEGRITITGGLMKVYEGAAVIADKAGACLLPIRIKGAEISKFSYMSSKTKTFYFPKISLTFLPSVTLSVNENIKGRARRAILSRQLYDVMTNMMYQSSDLNQNIFNGLLGASLRFGKSHKIVEDYNRKPLRYKDLLLKSYVLGEAYKTHFSDEKIGLMLPNSLADIVSFYALQAVDKTPVMMNFSHGPRQIESCAKAVGLKTIITSSAFIAQAHLERQEEALKNAGVHLVYLEKFAKKISLLTKIKGFIAYHQRRKPVKSAQETAVVLFTSGSEGLPKAVFLSHHNLQANRYQLASVLSFNASDVFMNALPMFHSFGLSIGGIITLLSGVKTFYYPSPLHYRVVPELFYDTNANIICGTDTFFYGYGRRANPYDFYNMKYAIVGGEKLKAQTADLWFHKFGVRILEGYGATETSPVIALNTPMYLKENTVGRLLPDIQMRLDKVKGITNGGRLIIKGDNVMQGYMRPEKPLILEAPIDGWYDTGDIVNVDDEGFISITGRAKRFAKIAGEMVSLNAVEEALDKLYKDTTQAILAIPDEKRGEQLVLITNEKAATLQKIRQYFKDKGLSDLWAPRQIIYMAKPPLLGTGKFDYLTAAEKLKNS